MKSITIKIHDLPITRYTTWTNLNIVLARIGESHGLFTDHEAQETIKFLETQPIAPAKISDILLFEASYCIDEETGSIDYENLPYMMGFGTGGFRANLRDWCAEYPLDFDVEALFYEYDDDFVSIRTHLESTRKRHRRELADQFRAGMKEEGFSEDEINDTLQKMELV